MNLIKLIRSICQRHRPVKEPYLAPGADLRYDSDLRTKHDLIGSQDNPSWSRRQMVKGLGAAGAAWLAPDAVGAETGLQIAGKDVEIQLTAVSAHTFRLTVQPVLEGKLTDIADDGTLLRTAFGAPAAKFRGAARAQTVKLGESAGERSQPDPLTFSIETAKGDTVQHIQIDTADRRSFVYHRRLSDPGTGRRRSAVRPPGQYRTHDERLRGIQPAQFRQPRSHSVADRRRAAGPCTSTSRIGRFDFTGDESKFQPAPAFVPRGGRGGRRLRRPRISRRFALPIDLFVVASKDPAVIMGEWARLTGRPELPPLWSFGYQQSHRTLARPGSDSCRRPRPSARRSCPATR